MDPVPFPWPAALLSRYRSESAYRNSNSRWAAKSLQHAVRLFSRISPTPQRLNRIETQIVEGQGSLLADDHSDARTLCATRSISRTNSNSAQFSVPPGSVCEQHRGKTPIVAESLKIQVTAYPGGWKEGNSRLL